MLMTVRQISQRGEEKGYEVENSDVCMMAFTDIQISHILL